LAEAKNTANLLAPVVREKNLSVTIQGREHVKFEGWTLLGSLLGVFPVTDYVKPLEDGFEARVVAKTLGGAVVGAAVARCTRSEGAWRNRDDFALSSMAQTRAGAKALRMPLGFIMQLAGYDATPAEEMGGVIDVEPEPQPPAQPRRSPPAASPPPRAASSGGGRVISDKQRKRLYAISMSAAERIGVSKDDINAYMKFCIEQLGLESSKDLTKEPYDALCERRR
jgi:hypothetical protein